MTALSDIPTTELINDLITSASDAKAAKILMGDSDIEWIIKENPKSVLDFNLAIIKVISNELLKRAE